VIRLDLDDPTTLAHTAARAASDKLAHDILILDVGDLLGITDHFVIVSANNERQLSTVATEVEGQLKLAGRRPRRREGTKESGWILLDYGDVVVHCFTQETRAYYELERLWADAPSTTVPDATPATTSSDR
jgi:ribosome-associated protein